MKRRGRTSGRSIEEPHPRATPTGGSEPQQPLDALRVLEAENESLRRELAEATEALARKSRPTTPAPIGSMVVSHDGTIRAVTLLRTRTLGRDRSRLVGKTLESLVDPGSRTALEAFLRAMMATSAQQRCEVVMRRRGVPPITVELVGATLPHRPDECQLVVKDVSAHEGVEEELRRSAEQLRSATAQLLSIREEERTLLARELHDDLGQALVAVKLELASLLRDARRSMDDREARVIDDRARELFDLIDAAIGSMRRISSGLRPPGIDEFGLWPAIEGEAAQFAARTGIRCTVQPCDCDFPSQGATAIVLFRIVQEALANVALHAGATAVDISCAASGSSTVVCVVDDGRGIEPAQVVNTTSLGMLGMRERARSIGGEVTVTGAPGRGTTVKVSAPINPDAVGR